jgi:YidC/Oxa1 family membrane protein insertase
MDKQTTIGFILIALVFVGWMIYSGSQVPSDPKRIATTSDSLSSREQMPPSEKMKEHGNAAAEITSDKTADTSVPSSRGQRFGKWFSPFETGVAKNLTIETDLYTAVFSNKGGGVRRWTLKGYSTWNKAPLQLIDWNLPSDVNLFFITSDGKEIRTENLFFVFTDYPESGRVFLGDSSSFAFEAILPIAGDSVAIVKRYTFRPGRYSFDVDIEMRNMADIISNYEYQVSINSPALTELNTVDEASYAEADGFTGGNRSKLDVSSTGKSDQISIDGPTHWVSVQNKYFMTALIARKEFSGSGMYIRGEHIPLPFEGSREIYQASMRVKYSGRSIERSEYSVYIGPMNYSLLKKQHEGLEQTLNLGWDWVVRPFSEYLIIPLFHFLHGFIPNYGFVILIFTLLIKLLLYPLTKTSMDSMRKMQALQPMITELRDKYKEDQQRLNTETMKLYRDYGINPAGGCLPMVLQMPILFALFTIFRSTIELRQQPFLLWISDLSAPDILFHLPFKIPLMGTDFISILALLMAITMFIQQKQTVKDPRQAAMVYMMPAMFWIMFNSFPSGLNLYYFTFNLLSILQQWYVNKQGGGFELKKVPQKNRKGWMEKAMANLEDKAKTSGAKKR